ncbi:protein BIC2 [Momordica charantia]|uniref:Protein BIC2 n=1 Tax=Momordica charantia TaxID=3673 RepID=A0A6J1DHR5_MOMCH|nr:protein BIC2 [Momordica charantia]
MILPINPASAAAPESHDGSGVEKLLQPSKSSCGVRERLKRHREEVAGKVTVPEKWGKEELLKDWIDYSAFDRILAAKRIATARASLAAEGRRAANSRPALRVESRC